MDVNEEYINKIIVQKIAKTRFNTPDDLAKLKRKIAKENQCACPSNADLLKVYHKLIKDRIIKKDSEIENLLKTRPVRSLSGIVNISVLTKPYPCPGKCIYCPEQKGAPKSYLDNEPAVMRAILNKYDPYKQVQTRISALENEGHPTDKIELRIIGGTWSYYPKKYKDWFVKRCFEACNEFGKSEKIKSKNQELERVQKKNERARRRIVGLSIETRPDFISKKEIKELRETGTTMVELGVQSIYDNVLNLNKRGHKIAETITATKLLKDAGFKVLYQIMPNLPGSNLKMDRQMFKTLFFDSQFRPDYLKIYPCALLKEAPLYKQRKKYKYKPYSDKQLIGFIESIKKIIPFYVRIQRITRDIPSQNIIAGPAKISNLRQILAEKSKKEGWKCRCIRCREIKNNYDPKEKIFLFREDYQASEGKEIFLTFENRKRQKLYTLLRMRICREKREKIFPVLRNAAIIREIHTYGQLRSFGQKKQTAAMPAQHRGLGKKIMREAEKIAKKEFHFKKICVISGVGARNYYRKLGYRLQNEYMAKKI